MAMEVIANAESEQDDAGAEGLEHGMFPGRGCAGYYGCRTTNT